MSFILESIKQAERDRKLGQVPSISVEHVMSQNEVIETNWIKWASVSIALIIAAFAIWAGARMSAFNGFDLISEVAETEKVYDNSPQLKPEAIEPEESNSIATNNATENHDSYQPASVSTDADQLELSYTSTQNLSNSDLKSVRVINYQEQEPQLKIVDKRTKISKQESIQAAKVTKLNTSNNAKLKSLRGKNEVEPSREKLFHLYSDLVVATEDESSPKDLSSAIQGSVNTIPSYEGSVTLASIDTAQIKVATPQLAKAVNTGVSDYGELPYAVQEKIPDLSISVHMFDEDPMQRRIRINGRMYTEGSSLQRNLALVEITRYGAIFDYQGHVFRLNVR